MSADNSRSGPDGPRTTYRADALFGLGVVALCALLVSALAWTRPAASASPLGYQQVGQLTYSAQTPVASVYGGTAVATGQPVYTNAVSDLTVDYTYRLSSSSRSTISGSEQLVASIDNGQGVVRSFDLQAPAPFHADGFVTSATLHLSDLQSAASSFEQMATVDGAAAYVVSIAPNVTVDGRLAGEDLRAAFNQVAQFDFRPASSTSAGVFSPVRPAGRPGSASSGSESAAASTQTPAPMTSTAKGTVPRPGGSPNTLLFGLSVLDARVVAPIVLVGALCVLYLFGRRVVRDLTARDERRRISARHGAALVEVDVLPSAPSSTVEVATFDGLLRVGRRLGCPLLHQGGGRATVYAVVDGTTLYRYVAKGDRPAEMPMVTFDPGPRSAMSGREANTDLVHHRG